MLKIEVSDNQVKAVIVAGGLNVVIAELAGVIDYIDKSIDDKGAQKFFRSYLIRCLTEIAFVDDDDDDDDDEEETNDKRFMGSIEELEGFVGLFKMLALASKENKDVKETCDKVLEIWNEKHGEKDRYKSFDELCKEASEMLKDAKAKKAKRMN